MGGLKSPAAKDTIAKAITSCDSCGATIVWGETVGGKRIPLDAPSKLRLVPTDPDQPLRHLMVQRSWVSHFETCPNADKHRRPR